jgi:hypothetical protein
LATLKCDIFRNGLWQAADTIGPYKWFADLQPGFTDNLRWFEKNLAMGPDRFAMMTVTVNATGSPKEFENRPWMGSFPSFLEQMAVRPSFP